MARKTGMATKGWSSVHDIEYSPKSSRPAAQMVLHDLCICYLAELLKVLSKLACNMTALKREISTKKRKDRHGAFKILIHGSANALNSQ